MSLARDDEEASEAAEESSPKGCKNRFNKTEMDLHLRSAFQDVILYSLSVDIVWHTHDVLLRSFQPKYLD